MMDALDKGMQTQISELVEMERTHADMVLIWEENIRQLEMDNIAYIPPWLTAEEALQEAITICNYHRSMVK